MTHGQLQSRWDSMVRLTRCTAAAAREGDAKAPPEVAANVRPDVSRGAFYYVVEDIAHARIGIMTSVAQDRFNIVAKDKDVGNMSYIAALRAK